VNEEEEAGLDLDGESIYSRRRLVLLVALLALSREKIIMISQRPFQFAVSGILCRWQWLASSGLIPKLPGIKV
jgi:hypothetical protein